MARVPYIEPPDTVPESRRQWNFTRALANSPVAFDAFSKFAARMGRGTELPARSREMAVLRVGAMVGSHYEWGRHVPRARASGFTDDQIRGVRSGDVSTLDAQEQVAVRVAEAVEHGTMSDALWTSALAHFTPSQLTELVLLSSMYGMVSRFLNAIDVDLDDDIAGLSTP